MNLLSFLLPVLFIGAFLLAAYLAIVRPAFIFWIRRRAVAIRDDLQLAILTGDVGAHEKSVAITMQNLNALIRGCEHPGLMAVILTPIFDNAIRLEADRDVAIYREAGAAMKEIIRRCDTLTVGSVVINSPFFWIVLPPLFAIGALTGRISRWINYVSRAGRDGSPHGQGGLAHA